MNKVLGFLVVFAVVFVVLYSLTQEPEERPFRGSCEDECPEIDYGLKCSVHSETDDTGLNFEDLGFCGDIPGRFKVAEKIGVYDKALKGHWLGALIRENQPACYRYCKAKRGPEGLQCRVPGAGELVSLITSKKNEANLFMPIEFGPNARGKYWSSTPTQSNEVAGFFVSTAFGFLGYKPAATQLLCGCFCPEAIEPELPSVEKQSDAESSESGLDQQEEGSEEASIDENITDEEDEEPQESEYEQY